MLGLRPQAPLERLCLVRSRPLPTECPGRRSAYTHSARIPALPGKRDPRELAFGVRGRLDPWISELVWGRDRPPSDFLDFSFPCETAVMPALLIRSQ